MSNEEIKAEIVKVLKSGENNYGMIFYNHFVEYVTGDEFEKAIDELIDCDRITDLEDGYLYLNY
jgi:hypothetical protein